MTYKHKVGLVLVSSFIAAYFLAFVHEVYALTITTDQSCYVNPATVLATKDAGSQVSVYLNAAGTPVANTAGSVGAWTNQDLTAFGWSAGSFSGTVNGSYNIVAVTSMTCAGQTYAACIAGNPGAYVEAIFEVATSCGPVVDDTATSTIEQSQENLSHAFFVFLASFFGVIWLLRKH